LGQALKPDQATRPGSRQRIGPGCSPIVSLKEDLWKPTTSAIQVFGSMATKNVVRLVERDAWEFMAGGTLEISADVEPGYVVVMSGEDILGCGLYSRGKLISQVPKDRRLQAEAGDILCS